MKTAHISGCGRYRYRLTRGEGKLLPVVMLNPSTADATVDDATIRRLLGFAQRGLPLDDATIRRLLGFAQRGLPLDNRVGTVERYDGIDVVNLYAFRATNPSELKTQEDPYGPENWDTHYRFLQKYRDDVVVAWGANATGEAEDRFFRAYDRVTRIVPSCFGTNKDGSPKHPLYLPNSAMLCPYFRR